MVDIILDTQDIRVLGGPSRVDLELDFGKQGARGSEIYAGYGKPEPGLLPPGYQIKDMYINLDPDDDQYSCVYQYITSVVDDSSISEWALLLRMSPVQKSINAPLVFTAGKATYTVPINNYFPGDVIPQITADKMNVQVSFRGPNPVAYSISNITVTAVQSPPSTLLSIEITASKLVSTTWSALTGSQTVQLNISLAATDN
jgi:hypothetical protein